MCDFVGFCALGSSEWVDAIGSVVGGIGAAAAAWTSLRIARSSQESEKKRSEAEAIALMRLITPEITNLPAKLHSILVDIESTESWWGNPTGRRSPEVPIELLDSLRDLNEDLIPYTSSSANRLAIFEAIDQKSIALDTSFLAAQMSELRTAAKKTLSDVNRNGLESDARIRKIIRIISTLRNMASELANEIQEAIGITKKDYMSLFDPQKTT